MFNGLIKVEKFDAEAMLALSGRITCLGEIVSLLAWSEGQSGEMFFSSWGENLGQIICDYGIILDGVVNQYYQHIDEAMRDGQAKVEESRQRREQGLVDPQLTADEILNCPTLFVTDAEIVKASGLAENERRNWAEKWAEKFNKSIGYKRPKLPYEHDWADKVIHRQNLKVGAVNE